MRSTNVSTSIDSLRPDVVRLMDGERCVGPRQQGSVYDFVYSTTNAPGVAAIIVPMYYN